MQRSRGMKIIVVVAVLAAGCGGGAGGASANKACANARLLCGDDVVPDTCPKDLAELEKPMGDAYGKTLACATDAKSCPEVIGCVAGGADRVFERWQREFDKGFDKLHDRGKAEREPGDHIPDVPDHIPDVSDPTPDVPTRGRGSGLLARCTDFKSEKSTFDHDTQLSARWRGCADHVVREIRCKTFIDELKCDCLEDGAEKWFFNATNPPLDQREDAERIATANCHMSFGNR